MYRKICPGGNGVLTGRGLGSGVEVAATVGEATAPSPAAGRQAAKTRVMAQKQHNAERLARLID
jgi:hypothetical protein